jgi:hypothetical protein
MVFFGFIFAFYRFSKLQHASLLECAVHVATGDDAIHVAIVPAVMQNGAVHAVDAAYTAFMGYGVITQPAEEVLRSPNYVLRFVPARKFTHGRAFLASIVGAHYNGLSLLSTLLPASLKGSIPAWVSREDAAQMPGQAPALFCSQLGLMLCSVIEIPHAIDPAACSPGDLERLIVTHSSRLHG